MAAPISTGQCNTNFHLVGHLRLVTFISFLQLLSFGFFSPFGKSTSTFLRPRTLLLQATYRGDDGVVVIQSRISADSRLFPPPLRVSLSRRLFRDSLTEGTLSFGLGPQPHVTISVTTPTPFDLMSEFRDSSEDLPNEVPLPGSASGFGVGADFGSYVMTLTGLSSTLRAEWGIALSELAMQVKVGLEVGLVIGFASMLTGTWTGKTSEISTSVGLAQDGVFLRLECVFILFYFTHVYFLYHFHFSLAYLEQRLSIPIRLSLDTDAFLALCTAIVPSTAFVLGYHFILKPHRRAQRAA
jgi:DnaJ family protein C protein 11